MTLGWQELHGGNRIRRGVLFGLLIAGIGALGAHAANNDDHEEKFHRDAVLVSFKSGVTDSERSSALVRSDLSVDKRVRSPYFQRLKFGPRARKAGLKAVMVQLQREASVLLVEPDYTVKTCAVPNDTDFVDQWALHNTGQTGGIEDADIDAPEAWDKTTGSTSVTVAIVDTGVDYMNPDLYPNMTKDALGNVIGYDFLENDTDPLDVGHGTLMSAIIGAKGNNALSTTGVCWTVKILPIRCIGPSGGNFTLIQGIDYARTSGAKIVLCAWQIYGRSQLLLDAIKRARDAGVLIITAAGNDLKNNDLYPVYPANYNRDSENVVSVAASDPSDALSWYCLDSVDRMGVRIVLSRQRRGPATDGR